MNKSFALLRIALDRVSLHPWKSEREETTVGVTRGAAAETAAAAVAALCAKGSPPPPEVEAVADAAERGASRSCKRRETLHESRASDHRVQSKVFFGASHNQDMQDILTCIRSRS